MQRSRIAFFLLLIPILSRAVVISEIMPHPVLGGEWIELYNNSSTRIDITNWQLFDFAGNSIILKGSCISIPGFGYFVILRDSETIDILELEGYPTHIVANDWIPLNNDEDKLVLFDSYSTKVDSMAYHFTSTVEKGRSWERNIGFQSEEVGDRWGFCSEIRKHTAGKPNSLQTPHSSSDVKLWISPNPFSPDNDGVDDLTEVYFELPAVQSRISIYIFNLYGHMIRKLASNIIATSFSPVLAWDGKNDHNELQSIGRYVVVLESLDYSNGEKYVAKCTVVLARR